jgi:UDP-2,3-diacylglucosamine hydrolase
VLAGDLFDLWLGGRDVLLPHQAAVLDVLRELRRGGMIVRYLEGNRDFRIGASYSGDALDEATDRGLVERVGGRSVFAIHGDLANAADRQYRAWRRIARSRVAWGLFRLLPLGRRLAAAEAMERAMRGSNLEFKGAFPEAAVRAYAATILARGHDAVVLGHFHVERDLEAASPSPPGRVLVLPEWKGSRRHLRLDADGLLRFESSMPA